MEYREIVAVTGIGGLYQLLATKSDGAIVRNLSDKSTKFISARLHNVTPLESIEIYTTGDNVRLHDVFQKMKDNTGVQPLEGKATSDNKAVKEYFQSVYPELDEERVYVSDMKKILKWYELLKANDLLNFEKLQQAATEEVEAEEEKPATKSATKAEADTTEEEKPAKKATKKAVKADDAEGEEKPAKKAAAKKATKKAVETDGEEKPAKKTAKKKSEE